MAGVSTWSEEEDDFLKRLAASGLSASEAAQQLSDVFGGSRTRSATLGRAHRLGVVFSGGAGLRTANRLPSPAQRAAASRNGAIGQEVSKTRLVAATKVARARKKAEQETAPVAVPALRPPAKQKHNSHNIRVKATRHLDERFDAIRAQRLAEVAAYEAKLAESGGVNPGVLFMERDMTKHCAAPMPGWDAAPIMEKRVCGAPIEWRSVQVGEAGFNMEPTSWCVDCRKRFVVAPTDRRADLSKLATVDRSVRRAA